ncbi:flavocytochrome c [Kosakonia radicincitans]|uniref:Fumarate reductase flavoprotein subunit n=1 Tax=Kosakonia radicincitans TaxID=283686 RepID=A0AAX2ERP2_9ENTR|nr:flavocytochrome c [Kosakonia radicincitans]MDP9567426.1 fumarate reductase flavoprotein subunit [Kosakonia oryzae]KDE35743.1 NADH:flavin oxidoreductase [Kosakonia radicincitans UMEnt01/12]SES83982.1 fumarate reductase flavoprotein subunit [Kosakonia radicincitans]SFE88507.1 fumarate reductase flavoprotein subunit [Kosakonia radicincitans]SFR10507.1 fumarate reductase flavoprotein subunit [Kosakonia radicincitans]
MTSNERILSPFTLPNGVELKNRLLMAPMTTCTGYYDGTVTSELVEYYRVRAGSIGTIIVECCFVDDLGLAFPGAIGIDNDEKIAGLAKIAEAIKAEGSKAILQIYHGGRMVEPKLIGGRTPIAPSAIAAPRDGAATPVAMTTAEVEAMVVKFGEAVRRAIQAGFDGVEIHGANTYLIQQFFSPNSNQRDDEWGGSRDNRAKFPLAVLDITHKMAHQYADDAFIIGYRFSPEELEVPGIRFDDTMFLLEKLAARGVDYLHFSVGAALRPSINDTSDPTPLIDKYCAMRSDVLAQVPVMGVGGVVNAADAEQGLDHGYDLIAVGRACIAYPDWAARIAKGENLDLFIDSTQREALNIPEPLWRFSLVEAMIRDMSMGEAKFKPGLFVETVQDDTSEMVINVSLETDRIAGIELASAPQSVEFTSSFEEIRDRILDANSPHVDAISGATSQSEAVKKAVSKAMLKSSKARVAEEGGDVLAVKNYDVVVVGSGGAGLAAAIQAHDEGASVLIVEKMPTIGGNTIKASAGMNAAETRFQRVKGIQDSKELFFAETLKGGGNKNNPELLRRFVENAPEAIEWLARRGIMLNDITTTGGMSIDRTHRPRDGSAVGGYLISGLVRNVTKRGIDVMLDTSVEEILFTEGEVRGVRLLNDEQETLNVQAKSVIVATGGFSANSAMVVKYRPDLEGFVTTNHKGATGGGIALLERLGAGTVDMGEIQIHPTVEQKTSYLVSESIRGGGAILVSQQGKRFYNEMSTRDKVSAAIIALPEHYAYIVFDEHVRAKNKAADEYIAKGLVTSASSPRELADKLGIDYHAFLATLERYNGFVEKQHDEDFGRTTALRAPINEGPFHAIQIAPGVHHTMGGVTINTETEVLNTAHQVIPGAYAAGEVVGGIHGGNRIGGNAVADIIIFGSLAGHQAAVRAKRS